jgi:hypothetical protein
MKLDDLFGIGLGAICALMFIAIGWAIYDEATSEKFYLRKDQWACTASHLEETTTFVKSGNTDIPITSYTTVCDQWSRR